MATSTKSRHSRSIQRGEGAAAAGAAAAGAAGAGAAAAAAAAAASAVGAAAVIKEAELDELLLKPEHELELFVGELLSPVASDTCAIVW